MGSAKKMKVIAKYIWLDGNEPLAEIRGKTKMINMPEKKTYEINDLEVPEWGFDGSSTKQAEGNDSDCVLKPVRIYKDPFRKIDGCLSVIVLNEVYLPPGSVPHKTNTRAGLVKLSERFKEQEFLFGIEQEYTLLRGDTGWPIGFPEGGQAKDPQGKYYCGTGAGKVFGRKLIEEHLAACMEANILLSGTNAEVMPGQWEYQVGAGGPLRTADDLVVARYLMDMIGEKYNIRVSLDAKPADGDWNGAGAHTNFSTKAMREHGGYESFVEIIEKFASKTQEHIEVYGEGIEKRLTGKHETCSYKEFKAGVSDRGASIRIPWQVHRDGRGYMEDRRPNANVDPYKVLARIMETVCLEVEKPIPTDV
jgi:glutamine synthetase